MAAVVAVFIAATEALAEVMVVVVAVYVKAIVTVIGILIGIRRIKKTTQDNAFVNARGVARSTYWSNVLGRTTQTQMDGTCRQKKSSAHAPQEFSSVLVRRWSRQKKGRSGLDAARGSAPRKQDLLTSPQEGRPEERRKPAKRGPGQRAPCCLNVAAAIWLRSCSLGARRAFDVKRNGGAVVPSFKEDVTMPLILWLLGVPLTVVVLLYLLGVI
jgi:hypothetical protein